MIGAARARVKKPGGGGTQLVDCVALCSHSVLGLYPELGKLELAVLDVHPPEQEIHTMKDFFLHLLTITVGLLIALGLENAAEAFHHRHQREQAEQTIRQELRENQE
jgi:hypothetical protein